MNNQQTTTKAGAELIADERQRQIEKEGYTPEHDAEHSTMDFINAARAYTDAAFYVKAYTERGDPAFGLEFARHIGLKTWPWEDEAFKVSPDPIRNLQKAGALIAAEIDRLQRLA